MDNLQIKEGIDSDDFKSRLRFIIESSQREDWLWNGEDEEYTEYFDVDLAVDNLVHLLKEYKQAN